MAGVRAANPTSTLHESVESPRAFFSYAHENWESAVRLVEELKLRGFSVFRDVERMREGRRVEDEMGEGVDEANLLMCYLTEHSLGSAAVVKKELKPALRMQTRDGQPVVMPVVCGLGTDHEQVTKNTWDVLQHDFTATWTGGILPTAAAPLPREDAASLAAKAVAAVYAAGRGPDDGTWKLEVVTHGHPTASEGLSVDATSFLGGARREVGHPAAWERVHQGVADVEQALRAHGRRRELEVTGSAHITAGFLTGFIFRHAAGWRLKVRTDDDTCYAQQRASQHARLRVTPEPGGVDAKFITAEVNLLGTEMDNPVDEVLPSLGRPALRLLVEHTGGNEYIPCGELAAMASATAAAIKEEMRKRKAEQVHLFIAGPFAFSVFLGAELNALGGFIQLYEWAEHRYHKSLELEGR